MTVHDQALTGGIKSVTYTVVAADTLTTIATGLKNAINADTSLSALGVTAMSASTVVSISSTSVNATTFTSSTSGGATETLTLTSNYNGTQLGIVGGTITAADKITITVFDSGLAGGNKAISYTAVAGDTLTSFASGLAAAVNANTFLQAIGVTASSAGAVVTIQSNSPNTTSYVQSYTAGATESLTFTTPTAGWQVAAVGGTKTTGNVLTLNVLESALSGGKESVNYTVIAADTLTTIATALASAINSDTNLQAIGVTANATSTIVNLESLSPDLTTYSQSVSSGSTETISLSKTIGVTQATYNNVNELVSLAPGGGTFFQGTTSKPAKSVTLSAQTFQIQAKSAIASSFDTSATGASGESIAVVPQPVGYQHGLCWYVTFSGTAKPGDVVTMNFYDTRFPGVSGGE